MPDTCQCAALPHLVDALERMAFVTVVPADTPPRPPLAPMLISIGFSGPAKGALRLLASEQLGALVAANIAGGDEPADAPAITPADALRELLNVTAGSLLAAWEGLPPGATFEMTLPDARETAPDEWRRMLADEPFVALDAEGHPLAICLTVEA